MLQVFQPLHHLLQLAMSCCCCCFAAAVAAAAADILAAAMFDAVVALFLADDDAVVATAPVGAALVCATVAAPAFCLLLLLLMLKQFVPDDVATFAVAAVAGVFTVTVTTDFYPGRNISTPQDNTVSFAVIVLSCHVASRQSFLLSVGKSNAQLFGLKADAFCREKARAWKA